MPYANTLCPYLCIPLEECESVNGEHILASALGTPESFKIDADESENQRLNTELDVPVLRSELMQLLAVTAGVVSRSGKDHAVLSGTLADGEPARVKLGPEGAEFSLPQPIDKDPVTGLVKAVKGFAPEVHEHAAKVLKGMRKRGIKDMEAAAPQVMDSTMELILKMDMHLLLRFMCRTAYLMTVATLGDEAITSESGALYRRALNTVGLSPDSMRDIGIGGMFAPPFKHPIQLINPYENGHTLACVPMGKLMACQVVLFGLYHATFITPDPSSRVGEPQTLIYFIDPATKQLKKTDLLHEIQTSHVRFSSMQQSKVKVN